MPERPGLYDMPAAEYHADPCPAPSLSSSVAFRLLGQSPRHAWVAHPRLNPGYEPEESEAFDLGTACHSYLLEGKAAVVLIDAPDFRTKDARAARDAARLAGKVPLLTHRWAEVQAMASAARSQLGRFESLPLPLSDGKPEQTLLWQEDGVWCRARLDWLHADRRTVDDYKTTGATANPDAFSRSLYGMGYDVQAAFYLRGMAAVFGAAEREFRFVVQETFPPYAVSVVALGPDVLELAGLKVAWALREWSRCLREDDWPAYPTHTCYAELPEWEATRWAHRIYREPVPDDGRPIEELLP